MGVWIETDYIKNDVVPELVTPCVGVWIETNVLQYRDSTYESHPAWVCGLKPNIWEITATILGHTLRGCVD